MCQAIMNHESIDVDETDWFPWLQKDRWWNTRYWNVDDVNVWQAISPAIELCNRFWMHMIDERHTGLQTFLYGRLDYWQNWDPNVPEGFDNKTVLLSLELERRLSAQRGIPCFGEYMTGFREMDWALRLCRLTKYTTWHVADMDKEGIVDWGETGLEDHIIGINSILVRSLMDDSISLSERCLITVNLAVTLLHESMHTIMSTRLTRDKQNDPAWFLDPSLDHPDEPALDFIGSPEDWEVGVAFEQAVFGGKMASKSSSNLFFPAEFIHHADEDILIYAYWLEPSPFPIDESIRIPRLTSLWASQLLSKAFWENERTPFGAPYQKTANNFQRRTVVASRAPQELRPGRKDAAITSHGVGISVTGFDEYQQIYSDWEERETTVASHRNPWYPQAEASWTTTPVSSGLSIVLTCTVFLPRI
ncbi:hypothetical protein GGR57DRAFT_511080 [Xylariaceae sp. FL1272]|nr:hypothetical protein GGR57DRAFT_511080 [Xylariaceae sp. FL1272]